MIFAKPLSAPETLRTQLEMAGQLDSLELPYHRAIVNDEVPLSIGGGIGQSQTYMYLLRKAHLGEVSVTVSEDGRRVIGHGAHSDIIVASGKAYVHALNKLAWHKKRRALAGPKGI